METQRELIIEILKEMLNREPTEQEISNAVTDIFIMGKVRDKELQILLDK